MSEPAGNCSWCEEPVKAGEQHPSFPTEAMHVECGCRCVVGSVAHVLRRCSCFHIGSVDGDPPKLTKREAARAAHILYYQIVRWYGEERI